MSSLFSPTEFSEESKNLKRLRNTEGKSLENTWDSGIKRVKCINGHQVGLVIELRRFHWTFKLCRQWKVFVRLTCPGWLPVKQWAVTLAHNSLHFPHKLLRKSWFPWTVSLECHYITVEKRSGKETLHSILWKSIFNMPEKVLSY